MKFAELQLSLGCRGKQLKNMFLWIILCNHENVLGAAFGRNMCLELRNTRKCAKEQSLGESLFASFSAFRSSKKIRRVAALSSLHRNLLLWITL
jgi:hypothetical protein